MKKVTPAVYNQVKTLKDLGKLPASTIKKITGLSIPTIHRIINSTDMADYKHRIKVQTSTYTDKINKIPTESMDEQTRKVLINLTDAIIEMTQTWATMSDKLDEVIETKRPWLSKFK